MLKIHGVFDVFMWEMLKNIVFFYVFGGRSGCGRGANNNGGEPGGQRGWEIGGSSIAGLGTQG